VVPGERRDARSLQERDYITGEVEASAVIPDLTGKELVIFDDITSSGGTMYKAQQRLNTLFYPWDHMITADEFTKKLAVKWGVDADRITAIPNAIDPSLFKDERGVGDFMGLIKSWHDLGLYHIQFNVVSPDTLRDAQKHPEEHRDGVSTAKGLPLAGHTSRALRGEILHPYGARNDIKIEAHLLQQFASAGRFGCKNESVSHFLKTKGIP
jgi:hypothetical protein